MTTAHRNTIYRSKGKNFSFINNINGSINYYYKKNSNMIRKIKLKNRLKKLSHSQSKIKIKLMVKVPQKGYLYSKYCYY